MLGIIIDTYRRWIEYQFTPEMNWKNIEIHQVRHNLTIHISDDKELKKVFIGKTLNLF